MSCDLDQQVSSLPGALASPSIKWENNCHSQLHRATGWVNYTSAPAGMATDMCGRS